MKTPLISDYAMIGDCGTAALIDRGGSIDWLCWPRFDSDACFARLLGETEHGCWRIAPRAAARLSRRYLPGTLVLETRFDTADGAVTVTDFMPVREGETRRSNLIRIVRCERGRVEMNLELAVRFQYGATLPWMTCGADGTLHQGLDVPADGRGAGRTDDFAARVRRRPAQLGLPLLLAARQYLHLAVAAQRGLSRRSAGAVRTSNGC